MNELIRFNVYNKNIKVSRIFIEKSNLINLFKWRQVYDTTIILNTRCNLVFMMDTLYIRFNYSHKRDNLYTKRVLTVQRKDLINQYNATYSA